MHPTASKNARAPLTPSTCSLNRVGQPRSSSSSIAPPLIRYHSASDSVILIHHNSSSATGFSIQCLLILGHACSPHRLSAALRSCLCTREPCGASSIQYLASCPSRIHVPPPNDRLLSAVSRASAHSRCG